MSQAGDSLWAIARNVQRESGGRVVDIVQALHINNAAAFIGNDANKLKIDARLSLSLAQIKSATPVERRAELGRAIKNIAQATGAAPVAASQSSPLAKPPIVSQAGDSLWAIARNVQRESGGRVVDIVQALHINNAAAFIGNDANKLKIDARLSLSLAQIKSATPVERRAELGRAIKNIAQATGAAPVAASQSSPLAKPPSTDGGGVLSLVTNSDKTAEVSPLTQQLSREVKASSAQVDEELVAGSEKVELVEERMDNLLNQ